MNGINDDEPQKNNNDASTSSTSTSIKEIRLSVEGMMCQRNCGTTVENALLSIKGAIQSKAIFDLSFASVTIDLNIAQDCNDETVHDFDKLEDIVIETIENIGFDCRVLDDNEELVPREKKNDDAVFTIDDDDDDNDDNDNNDNKGIQAIYQIIGMSCTVCTTKVERALLSTSYINTARVNLSSCQAKVQLSHPISNVDKCAALVQSLGYTCRTLQVKDKNTNKMLENNITNDPSCVLDPSKEEMKAWLHLLIVSCVFTIPLMFIHFTTMKNVQASMMDGQPPCLNEWIMLLLSTPVQFYVGKRFYIAAYRNVMHGCILGMDALIVLGTTASYLYSIIIFTLQYTNSNNHTNSHHGTFTSPTFETSAMLLTFVTFGKYLEAYAKGKTAQALYKLLELQPSNALKVTNHIDNNMINIPSLQTMSISLDQVHANDYLLVLPGNRIPTDGILAATSSSSLSSTSSEGSNNNSTVYVDESAFSGEPFPIPKSIGDTLIGSSLNQLSTIVIQVTATGQDTVISQIISCMEDAQSQVAPIQNFADKVASIFAPFVICCSIITFLSWKLVFIFTNSSHDMSPSEQFFNAFMSSISVIVVACPCALGLATPTAVMVGTGVGASHGLLIKGGNVLEKAQSVDTIVFDKTGTITTGKAVLNRRYDLDNDLLLQYNTNCPIKDNHNISLWLASCAESTSEHPLSIAIVNAAKSLWGADYTHSMSDSVSVTNNQIYPGDGVECCVCQEDWGTFMIRVGRKDWVLDNNKENSDLNHNNDHIDPIGNNLAEQLRNEGQIVVFLSIKQLKSNTTTTTQIKSSLNDQTNNNQLEQKFQIISLFSIMDPIKSTAQPCIQTLLNMNIDVWMCTGDHELSAYHVAKEVGIDRHNVCANVHPQGKADFIKRLQTPSDDNDDDDDDDDNHIYYHGTSNHSLCTKLWNFICCRVTNNKQQPRIVAMVGDGINDAVALATADVGIAIGAGTEIAMEAASIVLIQNSLYDVITALHLSRKVFNRIKWNFFWALCYNICSLPIAAGILYPILKWKLSPAFAGLMMAFSSVSVVCSSLLLRCYNKPNIQVGKDGKLLPPNKGLSITTSERSDSSSCFSCCCCNPSSFCCWPSSKGKYNTITRNSSVEDGLELL